MGFSFQNNSQLLDFSYKMDLVFFVGAGDWGTGIVREGKNLLQRENSVFLPN